MYANHFVAVDEYNPGYSKVTAFQDLDPGFLISRKFAWLHNRVLLHTQDELQELETSLEEFDKWEFAEGDKRNLPCRRIDEDNPDSFRKDLLLRIKGKLQEYDEILFWTQKMQAIKKPSKRNQNSIYNLITTTRSISSGEDLWIRHWDDLAALAHDTEHGWFHGAVEDLLRASSPRITLVRLFFTTSLSFAQSHSRSMPSSAP